MASLLTISQLAKVAGVHVQTVRYYERCHLLKPLARSASRYRLYGTNEAQRLRFIKNAQALGFTLREIDELLSLQVNGRARCSDVQRKAKAKLQSVEAKIQDLHALARALSGLIRTCRAGRPVECCQILHHMEREQTASPQPKNGGTRDKSERNAV